MNNQFHLKSQMPTYRLLAFISICAFFIWAQYEFYQSVTFSINLVQNFSYYQVQMVEPWWITTFYGSELGGTVGGIFRWLASFIALYTGFIYWRNGPSALQHIKSKIGVALLFEAIYFLSLIPTIWLGFIYPSTAGNLWYFEVTPIWEVFFSAGLTSLSMVLVLPPVLLKLRSKILQNASQTDIIRWSCITVVAYLFVVFWFNTTMQWAGMIATWGPEILLDVLNFTGFVASTIGLFAVAAFTLLFMLSAIRKQGDSMFTHKHIGVSAVGLGSYFILGIIIYFAAGGFSARPTAWYELIVPHNPYLWCLIFLFIGLSLLLRIREK